MAQKKGGGQGRPENLPCQAVGDYSVNPGGALPGGVHDGAEQAIMDSKRLAAWLRAALSFSGRSGC